MFKYELHMHSAACSLCASQSMEDIAYALKEKGFSGAVITNHFYHGNTCVSRSLEWKEFVKRYREDYEKGAELCEKYNIKLFFGIEEGISEDIGKEVLIYGVSPSVIENNPSLRHSSLRKIADIIHSAGGLVIQAHPYRNREYIQNPNGEIFDEYLDGIEFFNACNTEEDNRKAAEYSKKHPEMILIAGSDAHTPQIIGKSYIETDVLIKSGTELTKVLKSKNFICRGITK